MELCRSRPPPGRPLPRSLRPHVGGRCRRAPADDRDAGVRAGRNRAGRRGAGGRRRGQVPRPPGTHHGERGPGESPGPGGARRAALAGVGDPARGRDPPRSRRPRPPVRGHGDGAPRGRRAQPGRAHPAARRAVGRVRRRGPHQPRRLGPRPPRRRRARPPVRGQPAARDALHEASLLAVERRPGRRAPRLLAAGGAAVRGRRQRLGLPGGGRRVERDAPPLAPCPAAPVRGVPPVRRAAGRPHRRGTGGSRPPRPVQLLPGRGADPGPRARHRHRAARSP